MNYNLTSKLINWLIISWMGITTTTKTIFNLHSLWDASIFNYTQVIKFMNKYCKGLLTYGNL